MKKLATLLVVLTAFAIVGKADTLQLISVSGNTYNGVGAFPYYVAVNGGAPQMMMCSSYFRNTGFGYTWQAHSNPIVLAEGPEANLESAWLFLQAVADHGTDSNIQGAVWWIADNSVPLNAGAAAWVALAQSQTFTAHEFDSVVMFYESSGVTLTNGNRDQNFYALTPEPGTLSLLGSGVVGLGLALRKMWKFGTNERTSQA